MHPILELSTEAATGAALLASFFWGTWSVILKYTKKLPLSVFYLILLSAGMVFIWTVGALLEGSNLSLAIRSAFVNDPVRVLVILLAGIVTSFTNSSSIWVMRTVGLALSQPISASLSLIVGTTISYLIGGMPGNMPLWRLFLAAALLIAAIFFSFGSSRSRPTDLEEGRGRITKKVFLFILISSMTGIIYSTTVAYGLKSVTQSAGLEIMPYLCLFISGLWIGALIINLYLLNKNRQWAILRTVSARQIWLISAASWVHYSGNVLHAFATRQLSSTLSWPLGMTSGLWTQLWGLVYGEYKGAPAKAYWYLAASVFSYTAGAFIISSIF